MTDPAFFELEIAPYRLLSNADLERAVFGPSLFLVKRMIALRELERRRSTVVSSLAARASQN